VYSKLSFQNCTLFAGNVNICSVSDYSNCITDYAGGECIFKTPLKHTYIKYFEKMYEAYHPSSDST
jgi:hypothetical protein